MEGRVECKISEARAGRKRWGHLFAKRGPQASGPSLTGDNERTRLGEGEWEKSERLWLIVTGAKKKETFAKRAEKGKGAGLSTKWEKRSRKDCKTKTLRR